MNTYSSFGAYLRRLKNAERDARVDLRAIDDVRSLLDGEARAVTHRTLPSATQKRLGAYFTGSALREMAWSKLGSRLRDGSVVLDPAVGAGDLLIPALTHLATNTASITLLGFDIHEPFIAAARSRLGIAAAKAKLDGYEGHLNIRLRTCSGLTQRAAVKRSTHIVMNPPFVPTIAPPNCPWGTGRVNQSAIFLDFVCSNAAPGTEIVAIVPDVLRSGTNYIAWRRHLAALVDIESVEQAGRFDSWADVDVAILHLRRLTSTKDTASDWGPLALVSGARIVRDQFDISVGTVVDYRSPRMGPWHLYLESRDAPAGGTIKHVTKSRRFQGRVAQPPFVAVKRTSSPSDRNRFVATIVNTDRPVAVENHLLVARPKSGRLADCKALVELLHSSRATHWVNAMNSCRHLTVTSLQMLPMDAK